MTTFEAIQTAAAARSASSNGFSMMSASEVAKRDMIKKITASTTTQSHYIDVAQGAIFMEKNTGGPQLTWSPLVQIPLTSDSKKNWDNPQ